MARPRGGAPRIYAYTFRIRIRGGAYAPLEAAEVWREVEVRGDQTLADLGEAIAPAFDFDDDHLWSFFLSGREWDTSTEYTSIEEEHGRMADRLRIRDAPAGREFLFLFDYGDEWHFGVKLARTAEVEPGVAYPRVSASHGEAPPQYGDVEDWDEEDEQDDDEHDEAYEAERERLLERFETWAEQRDLSEDTWLAPAMLDYQWEEADGEPTRWTADGLRDFLLEWCPITMAVPDEKIPRMVQSARAFLFFLDDAGLLHPDGDGHGALDATLDWIAPQIEAAMRDVSGFSPSRAAGSAMRSAPAFPPVALPSLEELQAIAAAAPALRDLAALTEWVGPGRKLTAKGNLTAAEARDLAATLDRTDPAAVGATHDGGLTLAWARELGLVRTYNRRLVRVQKGRDLLDDHLELFNRAFDALPALSAVLLPSGMVESAFPGGLAEAIFDLLSALYIADEPMPAAELIEHVWEEHVLDVLERAGAPDPALEMSRVTTEIEASLLLLQLKQMGVLFGVDIALQLTPLGVWRSNVLLCAAGVDAPVIGDLTDADVEPLIEGVVSYDEEACRAELRAWSQRRGDDAARELAAYARTTPGFERQMLALVGLEEAGPAAEAEVRAMLDDEALRPQAQMWLVRNGHEDSASLDPVAPTLLMAETLATILQADGPASLVAQVEGLGPPEEQIAMVESLWQAPTPRVVDVLDAIGKAHPAPEVSKSARKAALKLRSADGHP